MRRQLVRKIDHIIIEVGKDVVEEEDVLYSVDPNPNNNNNNNINNFYGA